MNDRIHPYLLRSLPEKRRRLLLRQAELILRFEIGEERVEEKEFDASERLRRHRIISRRTHRGESYTRYSSFIVEQIERGEDLESISRGLTDRFDRELTDLAARFLQVPDALTSYRELVPQEQWPSLLLMAGDPADIELLKDELRATGLTLQNDPSLARFRILRFACPPETVIVERLAALPHVGMLADPLTPIQRVPPIEATGPEEVRAVLNLDQHQSGAFGDLAKIAVLDTGLDRSHPAFDGCRGLVYRNFTSEDDGDLDGHGTFIASLLAGKGVTPRGEFKGLLPEARLLVGKVISRAGCGDLESILYGMAWAVFEEGVDVLSFSLGDPEAPTNGRSIWSQACEEASRRGVIVCVAAGNVEEPAFPGTVTVPGDAPSVVTIGAVSRQGTLAPFSALGSPEKGAALYGKPNCVAPGTSILGARSSLTSVPALEGCEHFCVQSGTSMSTPIVAACLALGKSYAAFSGIRIDPQDLVRVFYESCRALCDSSGERYSPDFEVGHGLIDMTRFLGALQNGIASGELRNSESASEGKADQRQPVDALTSVAVGSSIASGRAVQSSAPELDPRPGEVFLDRFERNLSELRSFLQPRSGEYFHLGNVPRQSFRRAFGQVRQVILSQGFLRKRRLCLTAVALAGAALSEDGGAWQPVPDLLNHLRGHSGLNFQDRTFYGVGVYSPVGWSRDWQETERVGEDVHFYFVDYSRGRWYIHGPRDSLFDLFDPESRSEKFERVKRFLESETELLIPGGQVSLEETLARVDVGRELLESVVNSMRWLSIVSSKGRSAIQRSFD